MIRILCKFNSSLVEKSVTFTSSVGSGEAKAYKFGKVVNLIFEITLSKEIQPWGEDILKIPKGYIPVTSFYSPSFGSHGIYIYGGESGSVVLNGNAASKGDVIAGMISYITT